MKKFEFSLKKLQSYKEQVLKREKNTLSELRKQKQQLIEEMEKLIELRKEKSNQLEEKIRNGLTPPQVAVHKHFINSIYDKMLNIDLRIDETEELIQNQLALVIEITKEIDSINKLEEKQLEEYRKVESKQQELFIEEFVSHKSFVTSK